MNIQTKYLLACYMLHSILHSAINITYSYSFRSFHFTTTTRSADLVHLQIVYYSQLHHREDDVPKAIKYGVNKK